VSYDDTPISISELPEDQRKFLELYEELCGMVVHAVDTEGYHHFNDVLSKLLAQANRWGYDRAKKED
jgi:hypothetical protein